MKWTRNCVMGGEMTSDIGISNKRQSDYLWGYTDAQDGKPLMAGKSPDYVRGWQAGRKKPVREEGAGS